ncbi:hypothetical protein GCM10022420_097980 [Streptomyces iranensis]
MRARRTADLPGPGRAEELGQVVEYGHQGTRDEPGRRRHERPRRRRRSPVRLCHQAGRRRDGGQHHIAQEVAAAERGRRGPEAAAGGARSPPYRAGYRRRESAQQPRREGQSGHGGTVGLHDEQGTYRALRGDHGPRRGSDQPRWHHSHGGQRLHEGREPAPARRLAQKGHQEDHADHGPDRDHQILHGNPFNGNPFNGNPFNRGRGAG